MQRQVIGQLQRFAPSRLRELSKITSIAQFDSPRPGEYLFYIPILRGMRHFDAEYSDIFERRIKYDYFLDKQNRAPVFESIQGTRGIISHHGGGYPDSEIFTGQNLYHDLRKKLLGPPEGREAVRSFERFLAEHFFNGRQVTLIPRDDDSGEDRVVNVKLGDEDQFPIYKLGDGLQHLIIITYNIFLSDKRCLFFIEEPDISMHPGMQRALINTMRNHPKHQYFLTTHSNHLLDLSLDYDEIAIFRFQKKRPESSKDEAKATFHVTATSHHDRNLLQDLGVRNSSVFFTNATIWVEGISDRLYLRAYMKKYVQELEAAEDPRAEQFRRFKEDYHYSFVEYQGSTLTHWTFDKNDESYERIRASFICSSPILIADGDVANKGTRAEDFRKMLGDNFLLLSSKEIESLLPQEIVRAFVKSKIPDADVEQIRRHNKSPIGYADLKDKGLGYYLNQRTGKQNFTDPKTKSGTVKNKVKFCEKAVELMQSNDFEWSLPDDLKEMCEKIFAHITEQNRGSLGMGD